MEFFQVKIYESVAMEFSESKLEHFPRTKCFLLSCYHYRNITRKPWFWFPRGWFVISRPLSVKHLVEQVILSPVMVGGMSNLVPPPRLPPPPRAFETEQVQRLHCTQGGGHGGGAREVANSCEASTEEPSQPLGIFCSRACYDSCFFPSVLPIDNKNA